MAKRTLLDKSQYQLLDPDNAPFAIGDAKHLANERELRDNFQIAANALKDSIALGIFSLGFGSLMSLGVVGVILNAIQAVTLLVNQGFSLSPIGFLLITPVLLYVTALSAYMFWVLAYQQLFLIRSPRLLEYAYKNLEKRGWLTLGTITSVSHDWGTTTILYSYRVRRRDKQLIRGRLFTKRAVKADTHILVLYNIGFSLVL